MEFFGTHVDNWSQIYAEQVLSKGFLSEGDWVRDFEDALERQFGMKNVVAVNSGTSALHLALVLAGVGAGDEVILPAQTFVATGLAVLYCGAKPVFADIGMDGNIAPADVARKITEKTKAVIAVSWGGNPCDLVFLRMIRKADIALIQDNAHALGATLHEFDLSTWSSFSCYSFQAIKSLSTGDGGALVCDWVNHYERAKRLRWFGIDRERDLPDETGERAYNLKEVGYKYHMNNVAAAIGLGNLHGFKERQERVKGIAWLYNHDHSISKLRVEKKEGCSYWLYDLLIPYDRKDFIRAMKSRGIPVSVVHVGIDRNEIFGGTQEDLEHQRYWDEHHVCLPIHAGMTDEDVEKVMEGVHAGW